MSEKLARELFSEAQNFGALLKEAGWIESSGGFGDDKSPVDLFKTEERPLVVGLFGGTGVGKSSLLNRLAGASIARTGVVRPTSMEITAYLHRDVHLEALPEHFDATSFSASRHTNDALADVMWVDMPDFDSDETANKEQVLQWLPHIDLLVYVVTPERYKDAEGWRMMLESGYRHAWLFVINQWDRADPVQYNDFNSLLIRAGFSAPQIFRTVCVAEHTEDQFTELVDVIGSLSKHNIVSHLQERGWMQRLERCRRRLQQQVILLSAQDANGLADSFRHRWQEFEQSAVSHLDRSFKLYCERFSQQKTSAVSSALKSISGKTRVGKSGADIASNIALRSEAASLWDDWLDVRCQDTFQQVKLAKREHGVPADVFSLNPEALAVDCADVVSKHLNQSVKAAIDEPGSKSQRLIAKVAYAAKIVLPLMALLWVAWRVVNGFINGAEDRSAYVGLDFLVNGLLLAGLGWVIPMIVEKVFVPSVPESVYLALHKGLKEGLQEVGKTLLPTLQTMNGDRNRYLSTGSGIVERINKLLTQASLAPDPAVNLVLKSAADDSED